MAGTAALRAGAGLVTVATAAGAAPAMVSDRPELMTLPVAELEDGSMGESAFKESWLEGKTVAAVGPGLGRARRTASWLAASFARRRCRWLWTRMG